MKRSIGYFQKYTSIYQENMEGQKNCDGEKLKTDVESNTYVHY